MKLELGTTVQLNNGVRMPVLGLGLWKAPGGQAQKAVLHAFAAGYRLIDTAMIYGNEADVGRAFVASGLSREDVFITTKLWKEHHGFERATRAFERSLKNLGMDYADLYLVHWPGGGDRKGSWKALENIYEEGRCRAIGVSNYTMDHLDELLSLCRHQPAVNQVELNPFLNQKDLLGYCADKGIQIEAYGPLTHAAKLHDPRLLTMAARYARSPAQLLIRWGLQHGLVEIPKSVNRERIVENADVFSFAIHKEDMEVLDGMDEGLRHSWDPTHVP